MPALKKRPPTRKAVAQDPPGQPPTYASGRRIARYMHRLLTEPGGVGLDELTEELGVSRKGIERYTQAIASEFPDELEQSGTGAERRVRFRRDEGQPSALGMFPVAAAFFAGQFLNWVHGSRLQDDFARTVKRFQVRLASDTDRPLQTLANKFRFFPRAPKDMRLHRATLDTVVEALVSETELDIAYVDAKGQEKHYPMFQPLTIAAYDEGLYLVGQKRNGKHRFFLTLERIQRVESIGVSFAYPHDYEPDDLRRDAFGMFQGTPQEVELRFAPHLATWVQGRRWHSSQRMRMEKTGHLHLSLRASGDADLLHWILGFGTAVEVLGPPELRNRVATELRQSAAQY